MYSFVFLLCNSIDIVTERFRYGILISIINIPQGNIKKRQKT